MSSETTSRAAAVRGATGSLRVDATSVRAVAADAGLADIIERVSSGRATTYVWLHTGTPHDQVAALGRALRVQWADGARRVRDGTSAIFLDRHGYVGVPAMPANPDPMRLTAAMWAELVDAVAYRGGALYLGDATPVAGLVSAGFAEQADARAPELAELLGERDLRYSETATAAGRALVDAALGRRWRLPAELVDGQRFSTDGGATWHVCAVALFGSVAAYSGRQRDSNAPCHRVSTPPNTPVLVEAARP